MRIPFPPSTARIKTAAGCDSGEVGGNGKGRRAKAFYDSLSYEREKFTTGKPRFLDLLRRTALCAAMASSSPGPGPPRSRFVMTTALRDVLEARKAAADALKRTSVIVPWVFFRMVAKGRGGPKAPKPITTFTKAWRTAGRRAGCPGRLAHDLRRTAVRTFVRASVPQRLRWS